MTKRRFRPPGYSVSTRGHSVLPRGTYGFAPRRFAGEGYVPEYVPRKTYDTSYEEYALDSAVTNATSFSDASLFENFDTASRSRGRDQKLISDATAAIPPSTSQMATSSRTVTSLPGRRFLSKPRPYIPEFDDSLLDTPKSSGSSLPTAHLSASAPPRPNVTPSVFKYSKTPSIGKTASKINTLKTTYDDGLSSVMPERSSRLLGGYVPRSLFRSGSPIGSGTSSPIVRSSYSSTYNPYHETSYHSGTPSPTYPKSTSLLGGYIAPRRVHRTSVSPYGSGTQSPIGRSVRSTLAGSTLRGGYLPSRLVSSFSPSVSSYASGSHTPITYTAGTPNTDSIIINDPEYPETSYVSRSRPRVLGTKRRVGSYLDKLRRKRAGKQGSSKYWPYINVEDINSEAGDVMSDTESLTGYYDDGAAHWDGEGAVGGYVDTYKDTYDDYDDYGESFNAKYMQEPDEYVPFKPRRRLESPGVLDLSPYDSTPLEPELPLTSRVPFVPSVSSSLSGSSKGNDLYFNSLVSSSAARARTAFKNNGLQGYDNASLVLSVEGDVVSPTTGGRYGFKYYHPPVPLVGRGIGDNILNLPSTSGSVDSFFGTYLDRLRDLRADVRSSLESKALTTPIRSPYTEIGTYTPSKPSESFLPYTSYRKRLLGGTTQRVDVIELPVSERMLPSETLSLTFPDRTSEYDRKRDTPYKLTVLDKIKIKAAIVASKVEVEPRKKRPRSKFAADKLRATRVRGEESAGHDASTSGLHASRPPLRTRAGYRIESRMDPTDIIYKPGSFTRMRAQVRDAHDKLDRHRQLLDRYLTDGVPAYDVQSSVQRKMEDMERRDPGSKKKY